MSRRTRRSQRLARRTAMNAETKRQRAVAKRRAQGEPRRIWTGMVQYDEKAGVYRTIDTSWNGSGTNDGSFVSGRLVSSGDAMSLNVWDVQGWITD